MKNDFVDYYELLQISPNAESETVHRVFRLLAARLHPDNPETGDLDAFLLLKRSFDVLSNPASRAAYDLEHAMRSLEPLKVFDSREFHSSVNAEENRRIGILWLLHGRRRTDPDHPGISLLDLEQLMATPREHLLFATWYLREKQHVRVDDSSNFQITAEGVDFIEKNLPGNRALHHLLTQGKAARAKETSDTTASMLQEQ